MNFKKIKMIPFYKIVKDSLVMEPIFIIGFSYIGEGRKSIIYLLSITNIKV